MTFPLIYLHTKHTYARIVPKWFLLVLVLVSSAFAGGRGVDTTPFETQTFRLCNMRIDHPILAVAPAIEGPHPLGYVMDKLALVLPNVDYLDVVPHLGRSRARGVSALSDPYQGDLTWGEMVLFHTLSFAKSRSYGQSELRKALVLLNKKTPLSNQCHAEQSVISEADPRKAQTALLRGLHILALETPQEACLALYYFGQAYEYGFAPAKSFYEALLGDVKRSEDTNWTPYYHGIYREIVKFSNVSQELMGIVSFVLGEMESKGRCGDVPYTQTIGRYQFAYGRLLPNQEEYKRFILGRFVIFLGKNTIGRAVLNVDADLEALYHHYKTERMAKKANVLARILGLKRVNFVFSKD